MKKMIAGISLLLSLNANAAWLSTSGTVVDITTYASTETILVNISLPGTNVEECSNKTAFAVSKDILPEARARMYSMLLAAQASGRGVVISYNDVGGCEPWDANPNGYRKIVRLRME